MGWTRPVDYHSDWGRPWPEPQAQGAGHIHVSGRTLLQAGLSCLSLEEAAGLGGMGICDMPPALSHHRAPETVLPSPVVWASVPMCDWGHVCVCVGCPVGASAHHQCKGHWCMFPGVCKSPWGAASQAWVHVCNCVWTCLGSDFQPRFVQNGIWGLLLKNYQTFQGGGHGMSNQ